MRPTEELRIEGDGARTFRLRAPRGRVQVPQMAVALVIVALSALAGVVLYSQAAAREPALALAAPISRGEVITAEHLQVVYLGTDDPLSFLSAEAAGELVGQVAVTDLEAGTLLTRAHVAPRGVLGPGEGVVGLSLRAGEYPTLALAPGDRVDVVVTEAGSGGEGPDPGVLVSGAAVHEVTDIGAQGERFVSLRMPVADAAQVAQAAADGRVRLVLVGEDR